MMLKTFINYLKHSGIWIGFVFNPLHWQIKIETFSPDDMNPKLYGFTMHIAACWIKIIVDDGSY